MKRGLSRDILHTCVYAFVRIKTRFLREPFKAQLALEGALARVRAHVHLEVRLATECRVAHLQQHALRVTHITW